ncbi:unnamed protein product [Spirodela intermedia]|uniref:TF-B3 domain-containing protein n=1 Tax=Spirodela intermedia TaxID=51605 RepID=A0A7I8JBX8_SPIIN|nr:unnamed protein product [Spirodela intermedia]CAA6667609.1 unnamed protein product [Spirodela intermedia]
MSVNHLPFELPAAWPWKLPVEPHAGGRGRELLFEKPLTPSDVGKLNRLVIPKQYAEKYFPLDGDSGLLLSFEDELGKLWQFRYSYWTSSQSYVLTKGWSRFIREKRLHAGDVVLFQRRRCYAGDRIFIGWKRRAGKRGHLEAHVATRLGQAYNPAATPSPPSRMLRLFGVNLRCGPIEQ